MLGSASCDIDLKSNAFHAPVAVTQRSIIPALICSCLFIISPQLHAIKVFPV